MHLVKRRNQGIHIFLATEALNADRHVEFPNLEQVACLKEIFDARIGQPAAFKRFNEAPQLIVDRLQRLVHTVIIEIATQRHFASAVFGDDVGELHTAGRERAGGLG